MGKQIVAIEMHLEGLLADLVPLLQLLSDVGLSGQCENCREPIQMTDDLVRYGASLDLARKTHHAGHAVGTLPARVLLGPERGHARIRPSVHVRSVVGAILHESIVCDAKFVEEVEHLANALVVVNHHVVVLGLPSTRLATTLRLHMRPSMHVRRVKPYEKWLIGVVCSLDKLLGRRQELLVGSLHALLGEWSGVLDLLTTLAVSPAVQHAAGPILFLEIRKVFRVRIVYLFGLLLRLEA